MTSQPKSLGDEISKSARLAAIHEPHVRELTRFVEGLRHHKGQDFHIPYFDPLDGGINARALFLMEAPGRKAKGSGFVSRDNPDNTAQNIWELSRDAGLDRRDCILWNVCPWYVGSETKIRAVRASEVKEATASLQLLLARLRALRCVALVGRKAQIARPAVEFARPDVEIVEMPHPSPMFVNRAPGNRGLVLAGFSYVGKLLR